MGTKKGGEPCSTDADCASNGCSWAYSRCTYGGSYGAFNPLGEGAGCDDNRACKTGLTCSGLGTKGSGKRGTCTKPASPSPAPSGKKGDWVKGCSNGNDCLSGRCDNGQCYPLHWDRHDVNDGSDCSNDNMCKSRKCTNGKCAASMRFHSLPTPSSMPAPSGKKKGGEACSSDADCASNGCAWAYSRCTYGGSYGAFKRQRDGESCDDNRACVSGICGGLTTKGSGVKGTCVPSGSGDAKCKLACTKRGKCKLGTSGWNKNLCCDAPWSGLGGCYGLDGNDITAGYCNYYGQDLVKDPVTGKVTGCQQRVKAANCRDLGAACTKGDECCSKACDTKKNKCVPAPTKIYDYNPNNPLYTQVDPEGKIKKWTEQFKGFSDARLSEAGMFRDPMNQNIMTKAQWFHLNHLREKSNWWGGNQTLINTLADLKREGDNCTNPKPSKCVRPYKVMCKRTTDDPTFKYRCCRRGSFQTWQCDSETDSRIQTTDSATEEYAAARIASADLTAAVCPPGTIASEDHTKCRIYDKNKYNAWMNSWYVSRVNGQCLDGTTGTYTFFDGTTNTSKCKVFDQGKYKAALAKTATTGGTKKGGEPCSSDAECASGGCSTALQRCTYGGSYGAFKPLGAGSKCDDDRGCDEGLVCSGITKGGGQSGVCSKVSTTSPAPPAVNCKARPKTKNPAATGAWKDKLWCPDSTPWTFFLADGTTTATTCLSTKDCAAVVWQEYAKERNLNTSNPESHVKDGTWAAQTKTLSWMSDMLKATCLRDASSYIDPATSTCKKCPSGQVPNAARNGCITVKKKLDDTCANDGECADNLYCRAYSIPGGPRQCRDKNAFNSVPYTENCFDDRECQNGIKCIATSAGGYACGGDALKNLGPSAECRFNNQCQSGNCINSKPDGSVVGLCGGLPMLEVYQDNDFSGDHASLPPGDYPDLDHVSIPHLGSVYDNSMSSLKVPPGYKVTLYTKPNFGGPSLTLTGDVPALSHYYHPSGVYYEAGNVCAESTAGNVGCWNNTASSLKFYKA